MTQRPERFGAALPGVGVMDMLRFNKFTIGWAWESDYGSPEDAEQFKALRAYSPVHNVRAVCYPPTLVTTADRDDRVVPWHSYKFAAELQREQTCANPVMIPGTSDGKMTRRNVAHRPAPSMAAASSVSASRLSSTGCRVRTTNGKPMNTITSTIPACV